jgi:hypothetical protein
VSSVARARVKFLEAVVVGPSLDCVYEGPGGIVAIDEAPGVPAVDRATLARAEALTAKSLPKGTKIRFSALPSLGPTAFSWTAAIEGLQFTGIANDKGTTGYGAEMTGTPALFKLKGLLQLAIAA